MIYLDNSATTRAFDSVARTVSDAMVGEYYNPSALYAPGMEADRAMDAVRSRIASALGDSTLRVIFTAGGTESNNLALMGVRPQGGGPGHYITTVMEHPSVLQVMEELRRQGSRVDLLPVDSAGRVDMEQLQELLSDKTTLVSVMQVNNETGALQDMEALGRLIRSRAPQALFHIDGVQGFLREPIALTKVWADMYSLSGHKIHGPKGVGALVLSQRAASRLGPVTFGGGQERGLRSGTCNVPGILGLGRAVEEFEEKGELWRGQLRQMKLHLAQLLLEGLPGARINGPAPERGAGHILSLSVDGVRGEVLLHALEAEGILVSTGSACSSHSAKKSTVLTSQGVSPQRAQQTVRISLGVMNTMEEMDTAAEAIIRLAARLSRFRRR